MRPDPSEAEADLPPPSLPDPGAGVGPEPDPGRGHVDPDHETGDPGCRGRGDCCLVLVTATLSVLLSLALILPSLYIVLRSVDIFGRALLIYYIHQTRDNSSSKQKMHQVFKRK